MGRPLASVAPLVMMRVTYDKGDFLKKKNICRLFKQLLCIGVRNTEKLFCVL